MNQIPIAVFAYNRPNHLRACLEAIERSLIYSKLSCPVYIYCDHPKRPEVAERVLQTRQVAESWAYPKEIIKRENNYGFRNIVDGITEMCNRYGQVIIIEDDIIISPDFLCYMQKGLLRYANEKKVFGITGYMYFDVNPPQPELFFQPYAFCWGWGTWKRAWDHFEWNPQGWEEYLSIKKNRWRYNCFGSFPFAKMAEKCFTGKWDAWACQWKFNVVRKGGLFLTPYRSLIWNCGCGGGTHGDSNRDGEVELGAREYYIHGNMDMKDFRHPRLSTHFSFPRSIKCDEKAMRLLGIGLLRQRIINEPKKRLRLQFKIWNHKIQSIFTRRPACD